MVHVRFLQTFVARAGLYQGTAGHTLWLHKSPSKQHPSSPCPLLTWQAGLGQEASSLLEHVPGLQKAPAAIKLEQESRAATPWMLSRVLN